MSGVSETEALRKPFLIGLLATIIGFVIVGGVIAILATAHDDRPEGIAERWLTAAGDLTRKGVHSDAEDRVRHVGDLALANQFITQGYDYDGKAAFTALEVGRGRTVDAATIAVPMKVTDRADDKKDKQAVLLLRRDGDSWRVAAALPADATLRVPSAGGPSVSEAPISMYGVALLLGFAVAVGASALVRAAGREHERLLSVA